MRDLIIGTRGSKLALWQANFVKDQLEKLGAEVSLKVIKTQGDKIQHLSFDKLEGKGFFTKELEEALLRGDVDLAVHSMKDLPTQHPEGLVITAVSHRQNPADWLLIRPEAVAAEERMQVKQQARVGTSSLRRKTQLLHFRGDLTISDLRGNVPTRIQKLRDGKYDAIVLAAAGITRLDLDLSDLHVFKFDPKEFIPAAAQGVLAYETAADDRELRLFLKQLHHVEVAAATNVERKMLQLLEGGCHLPFGAYCEPDIMGNYHAYAAYAESADSAVRFAMASSSTTSGLAETVLAQLGVAVAE